MNVTKMTVVEKVYLLKIIFYDFLVSTTSSLKIEVDNYI